MTKQPRRKSHLRLRMRCGYWDGQAFQEIDQYDHICRQLVKMMDDGHPGRNG